MSGEASTAVTAHETPLCRFGLLAGPRSSGYTIGMKTAISIPDEIYRRAERLAKKTKRSRSRLFSDALNEYLARHGDDDVTETMNRVVETVGEGTSDPFVSAATNRILKRSNW